jgi:carbonic anhydrase
MDLQRVVGVGPGDARGQDISVHGWVYSLSNGLVNDMDVTVTRPQQIKQLG